MRILHTIFVFFIISISFFFSFWSKPVFADNYISQINEESSSLKVEKLQQVFRELDLYSGEITGNFEDIRDELIKYQVENNIIPSRDHYEAGYFWNKTFQSLEKQYGQRFITAKENFLKLEIPGIEEEWFFIVTAYYSPKPWQDKYQTGTYAGDIRLNGKWITASGKIPYAWALAAPRNYPFGTKVFLEWVWIWVVEDRGGAIVNSGERGHLYDRIDIWMWEGDAGRERAIRWWKRKVKGFLVDISTDSYLEFSSSPIDEFGDIRLDPENPVEENVRKIQKMFKKIGIYTGEITGNFEDIKVDIIKFQVENNIVSSKEHQHAGYIGPKTYAVLRERFWSKDFFISVADEASNNTFSTSQNNELLLDELSVQEKQKMQEIKQRLDTYIENRSLDSQQKEEMQKLLEQKLSQIERKLQTKKQKLLFSYLLSLYS